ncbi:hypothetical protein Pmani_033598 [Petrolisthes manimaculis]|uniref:C2H2-type domain-containing protein n=1 Tax=Petrolisthes manimaculis TaxID=1843537 RepID=A0AAE1NR86_9EUCA|nr:hypothetical protein Pmani_033598 [Petrolisthes manimaculis]
MRPAEGSSGQGGSPSEPLVLRPVSPASSPTKSSIDTSTPQSIISNMQLVTTADGKKLVLTNFTSPSKPSVGKQVLLMPQSEVNVASPSATAAVLSSRIGQPFVTPVMSTNTPSTVVVNSTNPVSPDGNSVPSPGSQPIVLQVPGLNQPIVVKQCSSEPLGSDGGELPSLVSQIIPTNGSSSSPTTSSTTVTSCASLTKATNPILYLKSGSATYKVVGKPVPVKLFPKPPKISPTAIVSPSEIINIPMPSGTKKMSLPPLRKGDEEGFVKLTSLVEKSPLPLTEPPAYLNIRIKEELKTCKEEVAGMHIKEEVDDTQEGPGNIPETSQVIDSILDVRIKEEPKDDQTGELLARDEQLRQVLGVASKIPASPCSKFYIRTSEGALVTISQQEAEALDLDLQDKVENNQKKLQNALHSFKASTVHKMLGFKDSGLLMKNGNVMIPETVNIKDFVSCHVSPAAELNASIMKSLGSKQIEKINDRLLASKSNTTAVVGEFTEPDTERRFLRVQIEIETHGKDVCDVEITALNTYQCPFCMRDFKTKDHIVSHLRVHTVGLLRHERTHVGEKPFRCQSCGKSFNSREDLKVHVIKHTSERPYECDLCEKSFTDQSALRCHRKKYHCDNIICVICLRGDFKDRIELREHLRAHERENWEETPDGDLVPAVRDLSSQHFISVDDTLENLNGSDESEGEPMSQKKHFKGDLGTNKSEENDISQGTDDDGDSEYEEHEIHIESSDPLA